MEFLQARSAGDVWALWHLWQSLGFEDLPLAWGRSRSEIDVLACLRLMVFNRLCDPSSKLGVLRWLQTVALPRGFGFDQGPPDHQQLLRAMDMLEDHSSAISNRLALLMRPLIDQELSVVFYDLTTVRVHGQADVSDDVRQHGMSKEGVVARQVMLSLVADRGLLSLNNLNEIEKLQAELKAQGSDVQVQFVLAVPAMRYGEFQAEMAQMQALHPGDAAWVDEMAWQPGADPSAQRLRLVVAHDPEVEARRTHKRRQQIQELLDLGQQWGGRLDAQDEGQRKRGRPLSDSGAKARLYHAVKQARLAHLIKVDLKSDLFSYTLDEDKQAYLQRLDGMVVTNTDAPAVEVIARYKSLADIERGFRTLKSDIEIGPMHHRLPKRIRVHALICFLSLILHRVLRMGLKKANRQESPTRLLEALKHIEQQAAATADAEVVRGVTKMAPEQKELFAAIGIPTQKVQEFTETASHAALQ